VTGPEERKQARQEAQTALEQASAILDRSVKIGKRWKQSREDNNFRSMIRNLGKGASSA
jgi:hypothetical protein